MRHPCAPAIIIIVQVTPHFPVLFRRLLLLLLHMHMHRSTRDIRTDLPRYDETADCLSVHSPHPCTLVPSKGLFGSTTQLRLKDLPLSDQTLVVGRPYRRSTP